VPGQRKALIVASDAYTDPGLKRLRAPASDARALAAVLHDPEIGGFDARTLLNEPAHEVNLALEEFFADRLPSDLLLVHFSCHGVKDEDGELYFAMANTQLRRLRATAVAAEFVNRLMNRSRSQRVVLLLDCCYAGAFEHGMIPRAGNDMGIGSQFGGRVITAGGRGRAVITASSAMEYAFEGDDLADASEPAPSVFTSALVQGLETGDADLDQDGLVALDELYDYVYDKVRAATPNQTPGKWTFGVQGELFIARRARPVTAPAPLPPELQEAADSPLATVRAAAVQELSRVLGGNHAGRALAAQLALKRLTEDDSRNVAAAAIAALSELVKPAAAQEATIPPETAAPGRGKSGARPEPAVAEASPAPAAATPERDAATIPSAPAGAASAAPAARPALRRAWIAIAATGVIVAAGVYLLAGGGGGGRTHTAALALLPAGCAEAAATLKPPNRLNVHTHFVPVDGTPFDVVVTRDHSGFVSLRKSAALPLVVMNTVKFVPTVVRHAHLGDAEGEALTHDRQYLLVAGGSGLTVFRVRDLQAGRTDPLKSLTSGAGRQALQVVPSRNDRFAFVAMQDSGNVAMFNLMKALAPGSRTSGFVRMIRINGHPTGMAASPDGHYLYVVSRPEINVYSGGMGTLTVVDMRKAEDNPKASVVETKVNGGCGSARVITSRGGKYVWVTAAGGNALEAYSATKLLSDPRHALAALVTVGPAPLGLVLIDNGKTMVVADSGRNSIGAVPNLAVIDVSKALAGKHAVLGAIRSGTNPHQFALEPDGKTLLVTNTGSREVEAVNVGQLP
jgi:DNA-binding beta-propeller fold protein YncE